MDQTPLAPVMETGTAFFSAMAILNGIESVPFRSRQDPLWPADIKDLTEEKQVTTIAAHQDYLKTG